MHGKAGKEAARLWQRKEVKGDVGVFPETCMGLMQRGMGPADSSSNPGLSGGVPAGPPRQRTLGSCWSCRNFGHLAANCPKKVNQYPLSCAGVPSGNVNVVCMSEVNIDPLHGSDYGSNELVIKPGKTTSSIEDGACSMKTVKQK